MKRKKIVFICGSPRRKASASFAFAQYLALFLNHDYEFIDLVINRSSRIRTSIFRYSKKNTES